jgi:hypothetical protein
LLNFILIVALIAAPLSYKGGGGAAFAAESSILLDDINSDNASVKIETTSNCNYDDDDKLSGTVTFTVTLLQKITLSKKSRFILAFYCDDAETKFDTDLIAAGFTSLGDGCYDKELYNRQSTN